MYNTNRSLAAILAVTAVVVLAVVVFFTYTRPTRNPNYQFVPGVGGGPGNTSTLVSPLPTESPTPMVSPSPTPSSGDVINIYMPSATPTTSPTPSITPSPTP